MKMTMPSRPLIGPKPMRKYTPAMTTDIRITLAKFARLIRRTQQKEK